MVEYSKTIYEEPLPSVDSEHVEGIKKNRKAGSCYSGFSVVSKGGMGTILRTTDTNCGREIAMKMCTSKAEEGEALERLLHEARVTANLEHPNIIPVHEINCDTNDNVYFTMKYVQGDNLETVISMLRKNDPVYLENYSLSRLLNIFLRICDGVAFAHSKGVIHRDLKPENIMVGDYGEVLIMDWGIAKVLSETEEESRQADSNFIACHLAGGKDHKKTLCGAVFGTPAFMAPEQIKGNNHLVDKTTDIYALGGILYSILGLRYPIMESEISELFARAVVGDIVPPAKLKCSKNKRLMHLPGHCVPESLSSVAMKALSIEQKERYQSIPFLQEDIRAYLGGFATNAEEASSLRKLELLLNRHSMLFLLFTFIICTALFSFYKDTKAAEESEIIKEYYNDNILDIKKSTYTVNAELDRIKSNSEKLILLAEKYVIKEELHDAKVVLDVLESLEPNNHKVFFLKGMVLEKEKSYQGALVAYKKALKRLPDYEDASLALKRCQQLISKN
ncbi:MAG: protein kinase [Lentisphaeraceae bacterium]|nr:protein kinase [Lentisphaeraceae bacterium]